MGPLALIEHVALAYAAQNFLVWGAQAGSLRSPELVAVALVNDRLRWHALAMDEPFRQELDQLRVRALHQGVIDAAE